MYKILLLIMFLTINSCARLEFTPLTVSSSLNESKERKVFIQRYHANKKDIYGSLIEDIWMEREWINDMDNHGNEATIINDSLCQLVISFKEKTPFDIEKYFEIRVDNEDNKALGSSIGVLYVSSGNCKSIPEKISLFVLKTNQSPNSSESNIKDTLLLEKLN